MPSTNRPGNEVEPGQHHPAEPDAGILGDDADPSPDAADQAEQEDGDRGDGHPVAEPAHALTGRTMTWSRRASASSARDDATKLPAMTPINAERKMNVTPR